ncbi:MAG: DUF2064 domain-containing protein [Bacteroidota bacterium]
MLLFAHSAESDLRAKGIGSLQFFESLTRHTQKIIKGSGIPCFHFSEFEQEGASFGERLANAFEAIFEKGYDGVISVGNDCPHISVNLLKQAKTKLETQQMVVGPTYDGGTYLIGMNRTQFSKEDFENLPWQQRQLFTALTSYFKPFGTVFCLKTYFDLDTLDDAKYLVGFIKTLKQYLITLLTQLVGSAYSEFASVTELHPQLVPSFRFNKGSPFS